MNRFLRAASVALVLVPLVALLCARRAQTVPLYAARTGNLCKQCHFDPNGGGPRNDFGFAFARNRHMLEPEPEGSPWSDLSVTNRVGETMPLYFGVNQRLMLLVDNTDRVKGIERLGFFNMENSLHFAFQPHQRLTLVYSLDAFSFTGGDGSVQTKDAYGMISGFPWDGYLKAGRFRNPFGLRIDDHTVATRNGFLDFATRESFLPYDPRYPDLGLEVGADHGPWYGRAAFTNGPVTPFSSQTSRAETKSVKFGVNVPHYQSGLSFYDSYVGSFSPLDPTDIQRATRWGYYGMTGWGKFAALGEVAAGTDEGGPDVPGHVSGPKTNRLAYFAELDYAPLRWWNVRVRYDHLEIDRSSVDAIRDLNTHDRYALESEVVPVPFAELRATIRRIDHKTETASQRDETQSYLQFHFNY